MKRTVRLPQRRQEELSQLARRSREVVLMAAICVLARTPSSPELKAPNLVVDKAPSCVVVRPDSCAAVSDATTLLGRVLTWVVESAPIWLDDNPPSWTVVRAAMSVVLMAAIWAADR